jgi:hypothetical protein
LKEETLDRTHWRTRFGSVVRQTTEWVNHENGLSKVVITVVNIYWSARVFNTEHSKLLLWVTR